MARLTIKRFGGQVPTMQPETSVDVSKMSLVERAALDKLLTRSDIKEERRARIPDSFSYKVTVENDVKGTKSITIDARDFPDELGTYIP